MHGIAGDTAFGEMAMAFMHTLRAIDRAGLFDAAVETIVEHLTTIQEQELEDGGIWD